MDTITPWIEVVLNVPLFQSYTYKKPQELCSTPLLGFRIDVSFGSRSMVGYVISDLCEPPKNCPIKEDDIKELIRVIDQVQLFGEKEIKLAKWISNFYLCSLGEAISVMLPSGKKESEISGIAFDDNDFSVRAEKLSEEQKTAIDMILNPDEKRPLYLFGHTGTGKTEVFLRAAEELLLKGKSIIYLVPEIALTHQVIDSVVSRFGTKVAVIHSELSGNKKLAQWARIRRGEATIVVGARSAVFAPVQNLGLIILDEEHDSSYKSGSTPRYHARQVAMHRCIQENCALVMGSATPSVEAWYQMQINSLRKCILTKRLSGGAPPEIKTISLKGCDTALTKELVAEIKKSKEDKRQSIIFLNRRGFTHFFKCNTCNYELICKNCSVPLTLHQSQKTMKCHYCGWQTKPPSSCPECGSLDIGYAGFGTEFIENEVRATFPDYSIQRVDTDSVSKKGSLKKALSDFRDGKIDILLGTQMVAKGLNFPAVRLVGIALADTGLHMPDFRAAERTFALITQVAGRAGRFFPDGKVIIQTWNPKNPAISYASNSDIEGFYTWELHQRSVLGFPPFSRLIRLVFRSKQSSVAEAGAVGAAKILLELLSSDIELLGPSECPLALISGNYRFHILLKGQNIQNLLVCARKFLTGYKSPSNVYIEVDVDPVQLL